MSVKDIIKKSVLEGFTSDITTGRIVITLFFAGIIGVMIYFVYKYKNKNEFYSKDFNITLIGLPIITSAIVLAMQSNLVISLGMVGALSIVRFRNAIKSPMDLLYLFWSISIGIICGGGIFELAFILTFGLSALLLFFDYLPQRKESFLLIINATDINCEKVIISELKKIKCNYKVKSRTIQNNNLDMIIEVRIKDEYILVKQINKIKSIKMVSLLSHDGEVRI